MENNRDGMSNDPKRTCPSHGPMVKIDGQGRLGKDWLSNPCK